jgi:hypothetical protein
VSARRRESARQRGQEHEREHHHQILDDEPADGDPPVHGLNQAPVLQSPQQHDRARDGEGETEHQPVVELPAPKPRDARAQSGRAGDLADRSRHRDPADGPEVADREVHADPEHQQDDADLRDLRGQLLVRHEPGRERTDHDAREQVADERRKADAHGEEAADEREAQPDRDRRDERDVVRHRGRVREVRQLSPRPRAGSAARA